MRAGGGGGGGSFHTGRKIDGPAGDADGRAGGEAAAAAATAAAGGSRPPARLPRPSACGTILV